MASGTFLEHMRRCAALTLDLYTWHDGVEIVLLATFFYYFLVWLNKDESGSPLIFWYGYSLVLFITYFSQLYLVSTVLLIFSPTMIFMLISLHQRTLQKSIIRYNVMSPNNHTAYAWLDALIASCLTTLNKQKDVVCCLERATSLQPFLTAPYYIYGAITKELTDLLLTTFDTTQQLMWVNHHGKIVAPQSWFQTPSSLSLYQRALTLTTTTDAIFLLASAHNRLFTLIIHDKVIENIAANQALAVLQRYIAITSPSSKEPSHEPVSYHSSQSQLS